MEAAYSDNNAAFFKGLLREPALSIGPKGVAPAHVGEAPQEGHSLARPLPGHWPVASFFALILFLGPKD